MEGSVLKKRGADGDEHYQVLQQIPPHQIYGSYIDLDDIEPTGPLDLLKLANRILDMMDQYVKK